MKFSLAIIATAALTVSNVNANTVTENIEEAQEIIQQEDALIQHELEIIAKLDTLHLSRVPAAATTAVPGDNIVIDFNDPNDRFEVAKGEIILDYDQEEGLVALPLNNAIAEPEAVLLDSSLDPPDAVQNDIGTFLETPPTKLNKHHKHHLEKMALAKAAKEQNEEELSMPIRKGGDTKSSKMMAKTVGEPKATPPPKSAGGEELPKATSKASKTHQGKTSKLSKVSNIELSMQFFPETHNAKTHKQTGAERMSMGFDAKANKEDRTMSLGYDAKANKGTVKNAGIETGDAESVLEQEMTATLTTVAAMVADDTVQDATATAPAVVEFTEPAVVEERVSAVPDNIVVPDNISTAIINDVTQPDTQPGTEPVSRTPDAIPQGTNTSGLKGDKFTQEVKDVLMGGATNGIHSNSAVGGHLSSKENVASLSVKDKDRANKSEMMTSAAADGASRNMIVGGLCLMASSAVAFAMMV